jgi:hypothetical protein
MACRYILGGEVVSTPTLTQVSVATLSGAVVPRAGGVAETRCGAQEKRLVLEMEMSQYGNCGLRGPRGWNVTSAPSEAEDSRFPSPLTPGSTVSRWGLGFVVSFMLDRPPFRQVRTLTDYSPAGRSTSRRAPTSTPQPT